MGQLESKPNLYELSYDPDIFDPNIHEFFEFAFIKLEFNCDFATSAHVRT